MLHIVSGIRSLCVFVNLILVPVPQFSIHLFRHPSLLPLLIYHSVLHIHNSLSLSLPAENLPLSQIQPSVVSLLPLGLLLRTISWTVSSELLGFCIYFFLIFRFCAVR